MLNGKSAIINKKLRHCTCLTWLYWRFTNLMHVVVSQLANSDPGYCFWHGANICNHLAFFSFIYSGQYRYIVLCDKVGGVLSGWQQFQIRVGRCLTFGTIKLLANVPTVFIIATSELKIHIVGLWGSCQSPLYRFPLLLEVFIKHLK